jgi:hypothetical protein
VLALLVVPLLLLAGLYALHLQVVVLIVVTHDQSPSVWMTTDRGHLRCRTLSNTRRFISREQRFTRNTALYAPLIEIHARECGDAMPSAVIKTYAYDAQTRELSIVFRSGGRYVYEDVPPDAFDALNAAFSKGEHFLSRIRPNYAFSRLEP